jgi:hypothetical protein
MKKHLWEVLLVGLVTMGGCIDPDSLIDDDDDSALQPETYTEKVYLIGTLSGEMEDELHDYITFVAYDGSSTDAPIVIAESSIGQLTNAQITGLNAAFDAHMPIVLVDVDADQIVALRALLGDANFHFTLPTNEEYAEIYAVDKEEDESIWQWVSYPPIDEDAEGDDDTDSRQDTRAAYFLKWLTLNDIRMASVEAQESLENAKSVSGASDSELTSLAAAFVSQENFSRYGNNYQVTHYVYGCHSIDTGYDWFYIQQQCIFYSGGAMQPMKTSYNQEGKGYYMDKIEVDSWMEGYDNNTSTVGMMQSSPSTANNVSTVTSGVSWNIGGEIGVSKEGASGKISGGVTISNSTTINISDCTVINKSNDRGNNAHWTYNFKRCDSVSYFLYAGLTNPPDLATATFQPLNQWIWRMNSTMRNNNVPMHVKLDITLCWTWGTIDFYWKTHADHYPTSGGTWEYDVYIPYPPLGK